MDAAFMDLRVDEAFERGGEVHRDGMIAIPSSGDKRLMGLACRIRLRWDLLLEDAKLKDIPWKLGPSPRLAERASPAHPSL
jgi:hypothetical protein